MAKSAIEKLRKDLNEKVTDTFENGTVIRWVGGGRFSYAAIRTSVGWFTTARLGNGFVETNYEYGDFVEMLAKGDASDIEVATAWESVT